MYHLKLIKGRSYTGVVSATSSRPDAYTEDEAAALAAVASGYFRLVEEPTKGESGKGETGDENNGQDETGDKVPDFEALAAMSKAELAAYAEEHEIDLKGCRTKDDMLEAISVAYGGSYTMIDLQK